MATTSMTNNLRRSLSLGKWIEIIRRVGGLDANGSSFTVFWTGALTAVFTTLVSVATGRVFDIYLQRNLAAEISSIVILAICWILADASTQANASASAKLYYQIRRRLSNKVFSKAQRIPLNDDANSNIGELVSHVTSDVDGYASLVAYTLFQLIQACLEIAVAAAFMFAISPLLTVGSLVFIPFWLAITSIRLRDNDSLRDGTLLANDAIKRSASETLSLSGLARVKSFNGYKFDLTFFAQYVDRSASLGSQWVRRSITTTFLQNVSINIIGNVGILLLGAYVLARGEISLGTLIAFVVIQVKLITPTQTVSTSLLRVFTATSMLERLDHFFEIADESAGADDATGDLITLERVSVTFPTRRAPLFSELSMHLKIGEWVFMSGPNGSGKSVFARLLTRLTLPSAGSIALGGRDIECVSLPKLRERIRVVSQNDSIFSATIRDNISYGREIDDAEFWRIIEFVELTERIRKQPGGPDFFLNPMSSEFSSGERQRIVLARALINPPDVLILDEATANIDAESEFRILTALKNEAKIPTVILISHRSPKGDLFRRRLNFEPGKILDHSA